MTLRLISTLSMPIGLRIVLPPSYYPAAARFRYCPQEGSLVFLLSSRRQLRLRIVLPQLGFWGIGLCSLCLAELGYKVWLQILRMMFFLAIIQASASVSHCSLYKLSELPSTTPTAHLSEAKCKPNASTLITSPNHS